MRWMTKSELAELIDANKLRGIIDEKVAVITGTTRKEEGDMKKIGQFLKTTVLVLVVVGAVCGIAYAIYKYLVPDYYDDDFDDEFDDDFDDDDLFEIDDEEEDSAKEESDKEKDE